MSLKEKILNIYDKDYKKLLVIPMVILFLAIIQIIAQVVTTGDFVERDVNLKGGSTITILQSIDINILQKFLQERFPDLDIGVREITYNGAQIGIGIESEAQEEKDINFIVSTVREKLNFGDYTVEITGSSLGSSFFRQAVIAMILAFVLMAIVVFIYFRTPIPSLALILCALSDIVETLAIFNLLGMKLSSAGIAAFLMLVGYSIDNNILLTARLIKRTEGTLLDRTLGALRTGMVMTTTTITVSIAALIFTNNEVIRQIMTIILIAQFADIINTWVQNTAILRIYLEKKHGIKQSS